VRDSILLRHIVLEQTHVGNFRPLPVERASCELMVAVMRLSFYSSVKINGKLDVACTWLPCQQFHFFSITLFGKQHEI
jgi:hypothetical protein